MKFSALVLAIGCAINVAAQQDAGFAEMSIPGVKGVLELNVGATKFETRTRPDGKETQLRAFGRADGLEITAFLQTVAFPASAEKCRDEWWSGTKKSTPFTLTNLQEKAASNGIARVEYIVPEYKGIKVQQKSVHAYVGSGELCAEIHLSKVSFKASDEKLFDDLLATVKLLPDESAPASAAQQPSPARDSSYYFKEGSRFYLQHDYSAAAGPYQKALDLEKQKRALSKDYFRVLVDNLGMSYGISGNLEQAKATFEFGLTQDSEYPMFFYNLACYYGEVNKMDDALAQLRLAYKYKANSIPGEGVPDPLSDDSFRNFVHNEEFVKAVHEMQK